MAHHIAFESKNLRISYMKRFCLFDTVYNPGSARGQGKDNSIL